MLDARRDTRIGRAIATARAQAAEHGSACRAASAAGLELTPADAGDLVAAEQQAGPLLPHERTAEACAFLYLIGRAHADAAPYAPAGDAEFMPEP